MGDASANFENIRGTLFSYHENFNILDLDLESFLVYASRVSSTFNAMHWSLLRPYLWLGKFRPSKCGPKTPCCTQNLNSDSRE